MELNLHSPTCPHVETFYVHDSVDHKSISINVQRDATICSLYFMSLQDHSTCFGRRPHSSSGVYTIVVTATGTCHMIVQLPYSSVANLATLDIASRWTFIDIDETLIKPILPSTSGSS